MDSRWKLIRSLLIEILCPEYIDKGRLSFSELKIEDGRGWDSAGIVKTASVISSVGMVEEDLRDSLWDGGAPDGRDC